MKRRDFIREAVRLSAAAGAIVPVANAAGVETPKPSANRPRVIHAQDPAVRVGPEKFDGARLGRMLDGAVTRLTDTDNPKAAWSALFSPRDKVGIKVNCLAGPRLSSHPGLVDQIVRGLRLAGLPDGNIFIWERSSRELTRVGYTINTAGGAPTCTGVDGHYDADITQAGEVGSCFAPFVSTLCTAHINVPVLKDHLIAGLGVGMKNFYGAIHNPNKYHDNHCDPYVADLNNHPWIRKRLRLIVCDALNGQFDGGPTFRPGCMWEENALLATSDPVALDTIAWRMIEERRTAAGLKSIVDAGREPKWLATANRYGLGENDPAKIDFVKIGKAAT